MSIVFVPKRQRGTAQINQETIQRVSELTLKERLTTASLFLSSCEIVLRGRQLNWQY